MTNSPWRRSQRTVQEAELERNAAHAFGRAPAAWALEVLGGGPAQLHGSSSPTEADFEEAGLSEFDARIAAKGLRNGRFATFSEAAEARLLFGQSRNGLSDRQVRVGIDRVGARFASSTIMRLEERRTAPQARVRLVESARAKKAGEGLLEACLIDAGEGSSGVYPATTLREAAAAGIFHTGLHCYLDHPTQSEQHERPERSVRDLAGCLQSDATFRENGLWASVRVFADHRDLILERASTIGMSIRADGELSERRSGRGKPTVERITKAYSVDFVTTAGRGGRIASW